MKMQPDTRQTTVIGHRRPITKVLDGTNTTSENFSNSVESSTHPNEGTALRTYPYAYIYHPNVIWHPPEVGYFPTAPKQEPVGNLWNLWSDHITSDSCLASQPSQHQTWSDVNNNSNPLPSTTTDGGYTLTPSVIESSQVFADDTDSDDGLSQTHPNKFPVEIEYHASPHCMYRRQKSRSGPKLKLQQETVYRALVRPEEVQRIKYYQKDLVRICRCGKYSEMDGALVQGRANDCDGYEIHYSQKCKWKAYDDYKTGQRVLIRLCKCYKPF